MSGLADLHTPALLIDLDRLERNISRMAATYAGTGIALRPHVKTSKCWQVVRRQLDAGAVGLTCSTAAEVAWLQDRGVADLLWANIPIGPRKVEFAVAAAASGGLTVSLDSVEAARPLSAAAHAAGVTVAFVLEVNTGQTRLGVDPERAQRAAADICALPGLRLRGVLTHEGHLAGEPDRPGLERAGRTAGGLLARTAGELRQARLGVDPEGAQRAAADIGALPGLRLRGVLTHEGHIAGEPDRPGLERAGRTAGGLLARTAAELRQAGHEIELVTVGSTPGATSAPFAPGVNEARPGTYVYYDANQTRLGSCTLDDCALTVLARVVSVQRTGRAITDAGSKAMSSDTIAAAGSVGIACDLSVTPLPGVTFADANEEHGFLLGDGASRLRVGDLVRLVPNHACGTTNMWSHVYAVRGDEILDDWPISARH